ncbi:putative desiccation-related protein PCC13-62-like [Capsicum annuum]|nr:putative desiccation-related protein PCC13-62-like [Capsicum annuum]KAF3682449.1 putative desiccation-related protein PCC13-62-like [Capsicum annuum]
MGLRGKLVAHLEVKCGGELFHDHFNTKPHHIPNISDKINHFGVHEGELGSVGTIIEWRFKYEGGERVAKQVVDHIDKEKKRISFKFVGGDFVDLYKEFKTTLDVEENWISWTFEYEKQNEDVPEPITLLGIAIDVMKDIDSHHHNK